MTLFCRSCSELFQFEDMESMKNFDVNHKRKCPGVCGEREADHWAKALAAFLTSFQGESVKDLPKKDDEE